MKTITPLPRQSLLDIALQTLGDADGALEIAAINGVCLTDDPDPATPLALPSSQMSRAVANYYAANSIRPATALSEDVRFNGINYMIVQADDQEPLRFWVRP